jgi:hypothetical protein
MGNRKWTGAGPARSGTVSITCSLFYFPFSTFLFLLFLSGCASPGEPTERKPPVPQAVTDLATRQLGNDVVLTFTLPKETIDRRPLEQPPAIEIFRDYEAVPGAGKLRLAAPANPTLLVTIPAAMVDRYAEQDQIRYADSLQAGDFAQHPDRVVIYTVRTRVSAKKDSADSNPAGLRVLPAPDPIDDVKAEVTHTAIVLTWDPPPKTPVGPAPVIAGYRVYRAEAEPGAEGATARAKSSPALVGETDAGSPTFSDSNFEFGKTYVYFIRSVVQAPDGPLESADSNLAAVAPRDTFPPAAPEDLVVVFVPAQGDIPAHLDLSWRVSPETDVAGYNVYRSDQAGIPGTRVNTELLLTPAFRDMNGLPGRRYFYAVTAVDHGGNEGHSSAVGSGGRPAENQPTP